VLTFKTRLEAGERCRGRSGLSMGVWPETRRGGEVVRSALRAATTNGMRAPLHTATGGRYKLISQAARSQTQERRFRWLRLLAAAESSWRGRGWV
jgi:hypothetical protein